MNCCCSGGAPAASSPPPLPRSSGAPSSWSRRVGRIAQWAIPLAALAMIPKCPACVAAYVFLFTGIGLSFHAAAAMRWALIAFSTIALAYLVVSAVRRAISRDLT